MPIPSDNVQATNFKKELLNVIEALPLQSSELADKFKDPRDAIQKWIIDAQKTLGSTHRLLYILDESSNTDLSIASLTSADLARFRSLKDLESQCHFNVFIAQVEKRNIGTRHDLQRHAFDEVYDSEEEEIDEPWGDSDNIVNVEWSVQVLFDTNGPRNGPREPLKFPRYNLSANSNISDVILQGDVFEDQEPDDEGELPDGYDPPVHPDIVGFCQYHKSLALLMIPQATTVAYLSDFTLSTDNIDTATDILEYFATKCREPGSDEKSLEVLTDLCEDFFPQQEAKQDNPLVFPEHIMVKILEVAIGFQSHNLFELVCNNIKVNLPPQFFLWMVSRLQGTGLSPSVLGSVLERSVFAFHTLGDQFRYIFSLNATRGKTPNALSELVLNVLDKMVDFCYTSLLYEQDGETLVLIACRYRDYDWLLKRLGPLVNEKHENVAFVLGFSWQLYASASQNNLQVSDSFDFVRSTLKFLIARFNVTQFISEQGFQRWQQKRATQQGKHTSTDGNAILPPPPPPPVTSQTLSNLCTLLLKLGMESDLGILAEKLTEQSEMIDVLELADLFVPFIGSLLDILEGWSISLEDPVFSGLARSIIRSFWNRYVIIGVVCNCWCQFCTSMNSLFANPTRRGFNFTSIDPEEQKHVDNVLRAPWPHHQNRSYTRVEDGQSCKWQVTKIPTEYDKAKLSWETRVTGARSQLKAFDPMRLWLVLGVDYYHVRGEDWPRLTCPSDSFVESSRGAQAYRPGRLAAVPQTTPPANPSYGSLPHPIPDIADGLPSAEEISFKMLICSDQPQNFPSNFSQELPQDLNLRERALDTSCSTHPSSIVQTISKSPFQTLDGQARTDQQTGALSPQSPPGRTVLAPCSDNFSLLLRMDPSRKDEVSPVAGQKRNQEVDGGFTNEQPSKIHVSRCTRRSTRIAAQGALSS